VPRPEGIQKLAKLRSINGSGVGPYETPMLVPSYSSKGFLNIKHIIKNTEPFIYGPVLFSAYDFKHDFLPKEISFPSLIFFDSGGYEAQKEADLSEYFDSLSAEYKDCHGWSEKKFEEAVKDFQPLVPIVHISYDHPKRRIPIPEQVAAALKFGEPTSQLCRELLIKPSTDRKFLDMDEVNAHVKKYAPFAVIGVTEKELGSSLLDRMTNVARLRQALQAAHLDSTPIHVFGSLDTISTLLYFVMGADVFDGLTWLRYGYDKGRTVYRHEYAANNFAPNKLTQDADEQCLRMNYNYLQEMELQMKAYITTGEFSSFKYNADSIAKLAVDAWGRLR